MKRYELTPDGFEAVVRRNQARQKTELSLLEHGVEIFRADLNPEIEEREVLEQAQIYARLAELCEGRGFRKGERAATDALRKLSAGPFNEMMERLAGFGGEVYDDGP